MQDFTDSVYIIEGNDNIQPTSFINFGFYLEILGTRHTKKGTEYHIKWEEYAETTWYVYLHLYCIHTIVIHTCSSGNHSRTSQEVLESTMRTQAMGNCQLLE